MAASGASIPPAFAARLTGLRDKLVLVTGGCGFVGSNIVNMLLEVTVAATVTAALLARVLVYPVSACP